MSFKLFNTMTNFIFAPKWFIDICFVGNEYQLSIINNQLVILLL